MPLPIAPIVILTLTGAAYWKVSTSNYGVMTPERRQIYDTALMNLRDPIKLRALAAQYDAQGLQPFGDLLRKRAVLRELPPNVRAARRSAYEKAMQSTNVEGMQNIAIAFDREGATGAAEHIRHRIAILQAAPLPEEVEAVMRDIAPATEVVEEKKEEVIPGLVEKKEVIPGLVEKETDEQLKERLSKLPIPEGQTVIVNSPNYVVEDHRNETEVIETKGEEVKEVTKEEPKEDTTDVNGSGPSSARDSEPSPQE